MVRATLELDGMTIETRDPTTVRVLWSLLRTSMRPDEAAFLAGTDVDRARMVRGETR